MSETPQPTPLTDAVETRLCDSPRANNFQAYAEMMEHARSLELKLRRSSESRERVEKALRRLIGASRRHLEEQTGPEDDDNWISPIAEAESALHAASKEGTP